MKRIVMISMMVLGVMVGLCGDVFSQAHVSSSVKMPASIDDAASFLRSPEDLASWISNNFKYTMVFPNKPQTVEETFATRMGDCDDLANLVSEVLKRQGVSNDIIIVEYKDLYIKHAVCAWKGSDGKYLIMDNTELKHTQADNLKDAIMKIFPDCNKYYKYQYVPARIIW